MMDYSCHRVATSLEVAFNGSWKNNRNFDLCVTAAHIKQILIGWDIYLQWWKKKPGITVFIILTGECRVARTWPQFLLDQILNPYMLMLCPDRDFLFQLLLILPFAGEQTQHKLEEKKKKHNPFLFSFYDEYLSDQIIFSCFDAPLLSQQKDSRIPHFRILMSSNCSV